MDTSGDDLEPVNADGAPFGVKLLVCFLLLDAARRGVELVWVRPEIPASYSIAVFILWAVIDLLLGLLLVLRTRAGRYWTQAILAVHVLYLGYTLAVEKPHLWLALAPLVRGRVVATVLLDGLFVGYLTSRQAKAFLDEGP